jgi:hypothetical protein
MRNRNASTIRNVTGTASCAACDDRLFPSALDDAAAAFASYLERADTGRRLEQLDD